MDDTLAADTMGSEPQFATEPWQASELGRQIKQAQDDYRQPDPMPGDHDPNDLHQALVQSLTSDETIARHRDRTVQPFAGDETINAYTKRVGDLYSQAMLQNGSSQDTVDAQVPQVQELARKRAQSYWVRHYMENVGEGTNYPAFMPVAGRIGRAIEGQTASNARDRILQNQGTSDDYGAVAQWVKEHETAAGHKGGQKFLDSLLGIGQFAAESLTPAGLALSIPSAAVGQYGEITGPQAGTDEQGGLQFAPKASTTQRVSQAAIGGAMDAILFKLLPGKPSGSSSYIMRTMRSLGNGLLFLEASQDVRHLGSKLPEGIASYLPNAPEGGAVWRMSTTAANGDKAGFLKAYEDFAMETAAFGVFAGAHGFRKAPPQVLKEVIDGERAQQNDPKSQAYNEVQPETADDHQKFDEAAQKGQTEAPIFHRIADEFQDPRTAEAVMNEAVHHPEDLDTKEAQDAFLDKMRKKYAPAQPPPNPPAGSAPDANAPPNAAPTPNGPAPGGPPGVPTRPTNVPADATWNPQGWWDVSGGRRYAPTGIPLTSIVPEAARPTVNGPPAGAPSDGLPAHEANDTNQSTHVSPDAPPSRPNSGELPEGQGGQVQGAEGTEIDPATGQPRAVGQADNGQQPAERLPGANGDQNQPAAAGAAGAGTGASAEPGASGSEADATGAQRVLSPQEQDLHNALSSAKNNLDIARNTEAAIKANKSGLKKRAWQAKLAEASKLSEALQHTVDELQRRVEGRAPPENALKNGDAEVRQVFGLDDSQSGQPNPEAPPAPEQSPQDISQAPERPPNIPESWVFKQNDTGGYWHDPENKNGWISHADAVARTPRESPGQIVARVAKEQGLDEADVHGAMEDIRQEEAHYLQRHKEFLKDAWDAVKRFGIFPQSVRDPKGLKDASHFDGLDDAATTLAHAYPEFFNGTPDTHLGDRLLERLREGSIKPRGTEETANLAANRVWEHHHAVAEAAEQANRSGHSQGAIEDHLRAGEAAGEAEGQRPEDHGEAWEGEGNGDVDFNPQEFGEQPQVSKRRSAEPPEEDVPGKPWEVRAWERHEHDDQFLGHEGRWSSHASESEAHSAMMEAKQKYRGSGIEFRVSKRGGATIEPTPPPGMPGRPLEPAVTEPTTEPVSMPTELSRGLRPDAADRLRGAQNVKAKAQPAQAPREAKDLAGEQPRTEREILLARIRRGDGNLTPEEKTVLNERLMWGTGFRELGEKLGVSYETARNREASGLKKLGHDGTIDQLHLSSPGNDALNKAEGNDDVAFSDNLRRADPTGVKLNARLNQIDEAQRTIETLRAKLNKERGKRGQLSPEREAYYGSEFERLRRLIDEGNEEAGAAPRAQGQDQGGQQPNARPQDVDPNAFPGSMGGRAGVPQPPPPPPGTRVLHGGGEVPEPPPAPKPPGKPFLQQASDYLKELTGAMFPRTMRLSRPTNEAMANMVAVPDYIKRAADYYKQVIGTKDMDEPSRQRLGAAAFELLRFRYGRQNLMRESQKASNMGIDLRDKARAETVPARKALLTSQMKDAFDRANDLWQQARGIGTLVGSKWLPDEATYQHEVENMGDFLDKWQQHMAKEVIEPNYRGARGLDPDEEIDSLTQTPGYPINAKGLKIGTKDATPVGGRGKLTNLYIRRSPFTKAATLTAPAYETDINKIIDNTLQRGVFPARQAEYYRTAVKEGVGAWGTSEDHPEGFVHIPNTKPPKGTQEAERGQEFWAHPDHAAEADKALSISKTPVQQMAGKLGEYLGPFNAAYLQSAGELGGHLTNMATAQMRPGMRPHELGTEGWNVAKSLAGSDPNTTKRLLDLSQKGVSLGHREGRGLVQTVAKGWFGKDYNPKWDVTQYLSKGTSGLINFVHDVSALQLDNAYSRLVKSGDAPDTDSGRRDFINQALGQYNARGSNAIVQALKDSGLNPFATATTTFSANAVKNLLVPGHGIQGGATMKTRLAHLAKVGSLLATPLVANYLMWGNPWGDDDTQPFDVKLGESNGKTHTFSPLKYTGLTRGMHLTGITSGIQGVRRGASAGETLDKSLGDIGTSALHPFIGPPVNAAIIGATGHNFYGQRFADQVSQAKTVSGAARAEALGKPPPGSSQKWENIKGAAVGGLNPTAATWFGSRPSEDWMDKLEKTLPIGFQSREQQAARPKRRSRGVRTGWITER